MDDRETKRLEQVAQFKALLESIKTRDGVSRLMDWLDNESDFYHAPASTRFHNAVAGGLVDHSLNVYNNLVIINNAFFLNLREDSMILCGLCHDICKANFYAPGVRNVKNEQTGRWETQEIWQINDQFPMGHGEKSVIMLLSMGIKLTAAEMYAIRWHMGGFDSAARGGEYALGNAQEKHPFVTALQMADMAATYFDERDD